MWKSRLAGFTLLEALVSLLVMSGSVLVLQSMTQLLSHDIQYQSQNREKDWHLFVEQFQAELAQTRFQKVEGNKLFVTKGQKELAFGKSAKDDFRKTDAKGQGYQPMLMGLERVSIEQKEELVHFYFWFENGLEREFLYRVEEKN